MNLKIAQNNYLQRALEDVPVTTGFVPEKGQKLVMIRPCENMC